MVLSNQTIATLSKFTLKARKDLGIVKVTDIINNQRFAYNLFVQATFSQDVDLMSLTVKLSDELNIEKNMIQALKSYIDSLKVQLPSENFIHSSKYYLIKLAQYVYGIKVDGISYRHAVNALLESVNKDEKTFCVNLARSFYPFWKNANSSLIEKHNEQSLDVNFGKNAFTHLWNSVDDELLFMLEDEQLSLYANAMEHNHVSEKEMVTRKKMAKVILIELRKYSQTAEAYRTNINKTQARLPSAEMREFFLVVSREFYSFWTGSQILTEAH